jgi:hypothetical protein
LTTFFYFAAISIRQFKPLLSRKDTPLSQPHHVTNRQGAHSPTPLHHAAQVHRLHSLVALATPLGSPFFKLVTDTFSTLFMLTQHSAAQETQRLLQQPDAGITAYPHADNARYVACRGG